MDPWSLLLNPVSRKLFEDLYGGVKGKLSQDPAQKAVLRAHRAAKDAFRRRIASGLDEADAAAARELVEDRRFDEAVSRLIMRRPADPQECRDVTRDMLRRDDPDLFDAAWQELEKSVRFSLVGSAELMTYGELLAESSPEPEAPRPHPIHPEPDELPEPEESADPRRLLESGPLHGAEGGTVPLGSPFYIVREADRRMEAAIGGRPATTLVVKGMRQSGKSSLLTRGIALARSEGRRVFYLDFQELDSAQMESLDVLMRVLALRVSRDLGTELGPDDLWEALLGAKQNFAVFLENAVLRADPSPVFFALDEVDRVFDRPYRADFFSAVRNWHNRRAEGEPWSRLSVAVTHATDPALWIDDLNQSPFNVGEPLHLGPFTPEQVTELGRRYGSALGSNGLERLHALVGGHPFLAGRALWWMVAGERSFDDLDAAALEADGPFGHHLRQHVLRLERNGPLRSVVKRLTVRDGCDDENDFQRLRAAGLVTGEHRREARLACPLYRDYFRGHL